MSAVKRFRPYQEDAISAILKCWQTNKSCLAAMATGSGKTLVAAGVSGRLDGKKILFLANRNELCQQPLATFTGQLGFAPGLEKAESLAPLTSRVVVGSVQTLSRSKRLQRFGPDHFDYLIADEAHMALAPSWKRIFDHFSTAKLLGITATPFRSDNKPLRDVFQAEAFRMDLFSLIDEGWLVNCDHVHKLQSAISLAQVRIKQTAEGKDYDVNDASDAILPYLSEIARELKANYSHRHILAFLPLVATSQKFVRACREVGLNAIHVDGDDPERDIKLQSFRDGRITLLANASLLTTGVDIPICDATLNLRPTRSKTLYQQIIGRSTRTSPGVIDGLETAQDRLRAIAASSKPDALILDPMWLSDDHDLVTPSFLIAADQEQAIEMQRRAGREYSLRALQSQIQAEREEAIRRRLESVARFREGRVNWAYFGAATGDHALVNYQPIFKWEEKPPTNFSRLLLGKAGIDPDSVASEGLAREVMRAIGQRRYQGMPEIRELSVLAESQGVSDKLWKITRHELMWRRRL
jgi:superfamily II DNA or RNA helicase